MRKIVLFMSISIDGFMAGADGDLGWHLVDEEVHQHFNEVLGEMGAFLDGRVTYELMADFWPTADEDPDAPAPMAEFAGIWRDMPKIVFSRTLESAELEHRIVREVGPGRRSGRWCAEPGGDMAVGRCRPGRVVPGRGPGRRDAPVRPPGAGGPGQTALPGGGRDARASDWSRHASSATGWCSCTTPAPPTRARLTRLNTRYSACCTTRSAAQAVRERPGSQAERGCRATGYILGFTLKHDRRTRRPSLGH